MLERRGNVLDIQGGHHGFNFIDAPALENVDTIRLTGGKGRDTYDLRSPLIAPYQHFVINNFDDSPIAPQDEVFFAIADPSSMLVSTYKNNLIFVDNTNGKTLTLENVNHSQSSAYRHIDIILEKKNNDVSTQLTLKLDSLLEKMAYSTSNSPVTKEALISSFFDQAAWITTL